MRGAASRTSPSIHRILEQLEHQAAVRSVEDRQHAGLVTVTADDDAAFRKLFAKSPVKRTGRDRFVRNVLIAIGNSGDAALAADAERLLDDGSALVRGAAVWALGRLLASDRFAKLAAQHRGCESDASVQDEWAAALDGAHVAEVLA